MNSKTITKDVNIEIPNLQSTKLIQSPTKRETVSSARRPPSSSGSRPPASQPIKHEPCSSTLGKFHDSVNFSLVLDTSRFHGKNSQSDEPVHRLIEAKNKYKYMVRQKSFVDESLFGSMSARQHAATPQSNDLNQYLNNHLTHNLMSNLTPLIVNPPIRSQLNSARSVTNEMNKLKEEIISKDTQAVKKPAKPWKP